MSTMALAPTVPITPIIPNFDFSQSTFSDDTVARRPIFVRRQTKRQRLNHGDVKYKVVSANDVEVFAWSFQPQGKIPRTRTPSPKPLSIIVKRVGEQGGAWQDLPASFEKVVQGDDVGGEEEESVVKRSSAELYFNGVLWWQPMLYSAIVAFEMYCCYFFLSSLMSVVVKVQ